MKKLVLLGLAILISMSVVAAASVSTMYFSGDIEDSVETKSRTGYFVWGVVNRAPLAEVMIKKMKPITGIPAGPTCMLYTQEECPIDGCEWNDTHCIKTGIEQTKDLLPDTYSASGWIKFNKDIPNDGKTTTPVVDFEIELAEGNPYYWDYQVINRTINEPNEFYVTRISKNTYVITCHEVYLKTKARLIAPYYSVESVIPWTFTATIQI